MPRAGIGDKSFHALRKHVRVLVGIPLLPAALRTESEAPLRKATSVVGGDLAPLGQAEGGPAEGGAG